MIAYLVFLAALAADPGPSVATPSLDGEPMQRASQLVELRGLHLAEGVYFISPDNWRADIEPQAVYLQFPREGVAIAEGAEVAAWRFERAGGQQRILQTPHFVGKTWKAALRAVGPSELQLMNAETAAEMNDVITDQYPRAGTKVYAGTSIFFKTKKTGVVLRNRPDEVEAMDDREVVTAWLMICPKSEKEVDGTAKPPTEPEIQVELNQPGRVADLRSRLSNPSWLIRQLSQYMGIRCNAEDEISGHFWESRFGMTRLLDEAAILACLANVDLNPLRAHMTNSLEAYPHVSIGERLRTLNDEAIDSSSWLSPIALRGETDGQPATVVNKLSREELAKVIEAQSNQPLGCLPMSIEQYAELLRWLSGNEPSAPPQANSDDQARTDPTILSKLGLDPTEFVDLVNHFGERFFTAAGCPTFLQREAARRGKRRLNGPGRHALFRREPKAAVS